MSITRPWDDSRSAVKRYPSITIRLEIRSGLAIHDEFKPAIDLRCERISNSGDLVRRKVAVDVCAHDRELQPGIRGLQSGDVGHDAVVSEGCYGVEGEAA